MANEDDLARLVRGTLRHAPLIATLGIAAAVVAYFVSAQVQQTYRATTTLLLDARRDAVVDVERFGALPTESTLRVRLVRSETAVLGSESVAAAAFDQLEEDERALLAAEGPRIADRVRTALAAVPLAATFFGPPAENEPLVALLATEGPRITDRVPTALAAVPSAATFFGPPAENEPLVRPPGFSRFTRSLDVSHNRDTFLLDVTASAPSPDLAARMANLLAEAYLTADVARKRQAMVTTISWLDAKIDSLQTKLDTTETEMDRYQREVGLVRIGDADVTSNRLARLDAALSTARAELAVAEARAAEITRPGAGPVAGASDPVVVELRLQLSQVQREIRTKSGVLMMMHPDLLALTEQRDLIKELIAGEIARFGEQSTQEVLVKRATVTALETQVRSLETRMQEADRLALGLERLDQLAQLQRDELKELMLGRGRLEVELLAVAADARIIDPASPPAASIAQPKLLAAMSGLVGGAAGLGFGMVRDRRRQTHSAVALLEASGVRLLGALPRLPRRETARTAALLGGRRGLPARLAANVSDAARALVDDVSAAHARLAVVSTLPEEGKTTIALALAASFARAGYRTLLVDGDGGLRSASRLLTLSAHARADGVVAGETGDDTFDLLALVEAPGVGAASLSRDRLAALERDIAGYERVVVDCPPLGVGSNALLLSRLCGRVILAAAAQRTTAVATHCAVARLASAGIEIEGVIFSRLDSDVDRELVKEQLGAIAYYHRRRLT